LIGLIFMINNAFLAFRRTFLGGWSDGFGVYPRQIWGLSPTDLGYPDIFGESTRTDLGWLLFADGRHRKRLHAVSA
jgi:hypothetical protein